MGSVGCLLDSNQGQDTTASAAWTLNIFFFFFFLCLSQVPQETVLDCTCTLLQPFIV